MHRDKVTLKIKTEIEGSVNYTSSGVKYKVKSYTNYNNVVIEFSCGNKMTVNKSSIDKGNLKTPLCKTLEGVGYVGFGKYSRKEHGWIYKLWSGMIGRAYGKSYQQGMPTYKDCSVHEDWHNFQNFAEWCDLQYKEDGWHLDKDLKIFGNKEYSEAACSFVPSRLNYVLLGIGGIRKSALFVGIKRNGLGYSVEMQKDMKKHYLGTYTTEKEASDVYIEHRCKQVREVASKFIERGVDCKVMHNLLNFSREDFNHINDQRGQQ